jgi:hypothetical protein
LLNGPVGSFHNSSFNVKSIDVDVRGKITVANQERRAAYGGVWVLALVFGWIEASVVVYLREISVREGALHATTYLQNLQLTLASLPGRLVALEMAREACTLVLLATAGWLAGRRLADRIGAFLMAFGIWDLTYYVGLRLISGWPGSISSWDILFLIPSPWVAPVWAPVAWRRCWWCVGVTSSGQPIASGRIAGRTLACCSHRSA